MNKTFLLLLFLTSCRMVALSQPAVNRPYWQQEVNYTINVSLNDIEHSIDGLAKIQYRNNSPDSLFYIWFHCWPNAYKNDQTAFSEQLLGNGRTDFYFSDKQQRGYINRLDFRVEGVVARMEDHPQYIDVIKLLLPQPLAPGSQIEIAASFHVQLPFNFSRGGHTGQSYQVTQWYPKPAVYDRLGWHPMPYLDQGGFYSEYGNYDVRISAPANYKIAATGELQEDPAATANAAATPNGNDTTNNTTKNNTTTNSNAAAAPMAKSPKGQPATPLLAKIFSQKTKSAPRHISSDTLIRVHRFRQQHVPDFAWFADKNFRVDQDTLQLNSGRIIRVYSYYTPDNASDAARWKHSIRYIKEAIRFHSSLIGEYPFNTLTAVEWNSETRRGMEYPSLIAVSTGKTAKDLDLRITHEIGRNWLCAALGPDQQRYPWMDEGINAYYDRRYEAAKYQPQLPQPAKHFQRAELSAAKRDDLDDLFADIRIEERLDQPIATPSADFTALNYKLMAAIKAARWMKQLEDTIGTSLFDSSMREYYRRWQFRHPYPDDFRAVLENTGGRTLTGSGTLDRAFSLLDKTGPLAPSTSAKKIKPAFLFSTRNTDKIEYINIAPAIGYNEYDKFMVGAIIHNFDLPPNRFQFLLAPLYATNSRQMTGIGRIAYSEYPGSGCAGSTGGGFQRIEVALDGARFSTLSATDSNGNKIFGGFYKIAPSVRLILKKSTPRSTMEKWVELKTFLIGEKKFDRYVQKSTDSQYYPVNERYAFRYLNQLSLNMADDRTLYPYNAQLQIQQASRFYRINFTGNYFFNYAAGGGMAVRVFAAKFGYLGGQSSALDLSSFEPKLTGVRGVEDYTYSNYFLGRSEFTGFASQQVMIRDGALKIQVPQFPFLEGRSDNWVAATNFNSTLPSFLFPFPVPLKVFLDIGTYAGGWQSSPQTSKFLYTGGLQLSLFHNILNFYAPIFYSSDFSNQLKTTPEANTFWKKISFSIDLQNIDFKKIAGKAMAAKTLD